MAFQNALRIPDPESHYIVHTVTQSYSKIAYIFYSASHRLPQLHKYNRHFRALECRQKCGGALYFWWAALKGLLTRLLYALQGLDWFGKASTQ